MNNIKLWHGDCLELMKEVPNCSVDMILCDLPYGTTACKWDANIPFVPLWEHYQKVIKDTGVIILFSKQPFTTDLINSNRNWYRYSWLWIKNIANGYLNAKIMPLQVYEELCVFYKRKPKYNPQIEYGFERKTSRASTKRKCKAAEVYNKAICVKDYDSTARYPINVLYFESDKHKNCLHPTQKPLALLEYLLNTYTDKGDLVLDNCMGSGTSGVACKIWGRKFIGMELEQKYFDIAKRRIDNTQTGGDQ